MIYDSGHGSAQPSVRKSLAEAGACGFQKSACAGDLGDRPLPINPEILAAPRKPSTVTHECSGHVPCTVSVPVAVPRTSTDVELLRIPLPET